MFCVSPDMVDRQVDGEGNDGELLRPMLQNMPATDNLCVISLSVRRTDFVLITHAVQATNNFLFAKRSSTAVTWAEAEITTTISARFAQV
jgi:hypothetical protein